MKNNLLDFCQKNRDKRIPNTGNYEGRHFLTMRQIETFANENAIRPSQSVIAYFSKIAAVERDCLCSIFECVRNCPDRPEFMINYLEIKFIEE